MILYIDAFNGISGDMILAGFFDIGFPVNKIYENFNKLKLKEEILIETEDLTSYGLTGKKIKIYSDNKIKLKRNYNDLIKIFEESELKENIKNISLMILKNLAEAEAKIHNIPINEVHFHEIGCIDTIIDILGFSTAVDYFKIDDFYISTIPVGCGSIKIEHGIYPNPSPCSLELLKGYRLEILNRDFEFTTPTASAIIKSLKFKQEDNIKIIPEKIGYGFGQKEYLEKPNCLRIVLGKPLFSIDFNSKIYEIKFNIDDMTGEEIGFFIEKCMEIDDILDVSVTTRITKKNRPGYIFEILAKNFSENILNYIFSYSTTSGIRVYEVNRIILDRYFEGEKKIFKSKKIGIKKWKLEFSKIKED